jgi:glycosyltransferase involved in cell wall biosynthesis
MSKPRVLHLIHGLEKGGAEAMLFKLLPRLQEMGIENSVVSLTDEGFFGPRLKEMGISVTPLGGSGLGKWTRWQKTLRKFEPNILQTWSYQADLVGTLKSSPAKLIWNIRCSDAESKAGYWKTRLISRTLARLSRVPEAVICNSESGRRHHERIGYRPKRWQVLPNGFDTKKFSFSEEARKQVRKELSLAPDASVIGIVARYDSIKDYPTFIKAGGELLKRIPNAQFVLVGRDVTLENPALKKLCEETSHPKQFHLLGERTDVAEILSALDIFSLTSISEGFPNVLGEAMAANLPCVVTDCGDVRLILGDTGCVVPIGDIQKLAGEWEKLLKLPADKRRSLGQRARDRVKDELAIERVASRYAAFYSEVLA